MEKNTNKEYIKVLTDTGKTALLLFFMACCKEGEGDNVEITPQKHKEGDPLFYGPDFKPYAFYHEGLYLEVSFERPSWVSDIFDSYSPFFGNYIGPEEEMDDDDDDDDVVTECYTFRLTDHLDLLTDVVKYENLED